MNVSIWHPDSFRKNVGTIKTDFIDCFTSNVIDNHSMEPFWQGFINESKRPINPQTNKPYLLKLKVRLLLLTPLVQQLDIVQYCL